MEKREILQKAHDFGFEIVPHRPEKITYELNLDAMLSDDNLDIEDSSNWDWIKSQATSTPTQFDITGKVEGKYFVEGDLTKKPFLTLLHKLVAKESAFRGYKNFNWDFVKKLKLPDVKGEEVLLVNIKSFMKDIEKAIKTDNYDDFTYIWGYDVAVKEAYSAIKDSWPTVIKYGLIVISEGMDAECYLHPLDKYSLECLKGLTWYGDGIDTDTQIFDKWIDQVVPKLPEIDPILLQNMPVDVQACVPSLDSKSAVKPSGIQIRRNR